MSEPIKARVARGAALMDKEHPRWWAEDYPHPIDLDRLDLGDNCGCVLGQTDDGEHSDEYDDGPFEAHSEVLFGTDDLDALIRLEIAHGFNAASNSQEEFAALTAEWRRAILARRGGEGR